MKKRTYTVTSRVLVYPGTGGWRFLVVPKKESERIKKDFGTEARGWGSFPVEVTIRNTTWKTSIFPDKQSGTYLLPLKLKVRKAEGIVDDDTVRFGLCLFPAV